MASIGNNTDDVPEQVHMSDVSIANHQSFRPRLEVNENSVNELMENQSSSRTI